MTTFPSTIKFADINVTTENNVTSNLTSLSGKKEVILGEQHQMGLDLKTVPLTELEDRSFQIFINEIRNYGLFDIALSNYTVFKPHSTSTTKMSVSVGSYPVGSKTIFVDESGVNLKVAVGSYIQFENRSSTLLSKLYQIIKIEENIINPQNNNALNTRITLNTGLVDPLVSYLNNNYLFDATATALIYSYADRGQFIYNYIAGGSYSNSTSYSFVNTQTISAYTNQAYRITAINDSDIVTGTPNIQTATIQGSKSNVRRLGSNETLDIHIDPNAVSGGTIPAISEVQRLYYRPNSRSNSSASVNTNIGIYSGISSVATAPTAGVYALNINTPEDLTNLTAPGKIAVGKTDNLLNMSGAITNGSTSPVLQIYYFSRSSTNVSLVFTNGINYTSQPFTIDPPKQGVTYNFTYNSELYSFTYNGSNITVTNGSAFGYYTVIWTLPTSAFTAGNTSTITSGAQFINSPLTYSDRAVLTYNTYNPSTRYFSLANAITTDQAAAWAVGTEVRILLYDGNFNSSTASAAMVSDIVTQVTNNTAITAVDYPDATNDQNNYIEFTTDSPGPINGNLHAFVNNNGEPNTYTTSINFNITSTNNFSTIALNSTTSYDLNNISFEQVPQSTLTSSGLYSGSKVLWTWGYGSTSNSSIPTSYPSYASQIFSALADTTNIFRDTGGLGIFLFKAETGGTRTYNYHAPTNKNWIIAFDPNTSGYDEQFSHTFAISGRAGYYGTNPELTFANLIGGTALSISKCLNKTGSISVLQRYFISSTGYENFTSASVTRSQSISGNGGTFRWIKDSESELAANGSLGYNYVLYTPGATSGDNASYQIIGASTSSIGNLTNNSNLNDLNNYFNSLKNSGEKLYISHIFPTSVSGSSNPFRYTSRHKDSMEIVNIDVSNNIIYTSGRYNSGATTSYSGVVASLSLFLESNYSGIIDANGNIINATITVQGRSSGTGTSFSFDPDLSNLVYSNDISNQSLTASSNADSILTQMGNAIDNLNANISWNGTISNGDASGDINLAYGSVNFVTYSRSTSGNTVLIRRTPSIGTNADDFTRSDYEYFIRTLTIGRQLKVTDFGGTVRTVTINGNFTRQNPSYPNYWLSIPISTSITLGNGIQVQYVSSGTRKISINMGTDQNITPSLLINNITGTNMVTRIVSTDAITGTGTSTTYTLRDPQNNITTSFLSSSTPIIITNTSDAQLNLSTNYTLGYTSGTTFTLTGTSGTLAANLHTRLNNGSVYYISGTSSIIPPSSNRILTATISGSIVTCTTYGAPSGITNNSTGNFIFYESTYSSDYQNVLSRLSTAITSSIQSPINYYGSFNSISRTLTATSNEPNNSLLPWSISVNNNGVTGNDAGDIRFNFGDAVGTSSLFTITQSGQRIVTPSPRQVTFNNVYNLPTLLGFTMGEANSANQLIVRNVNTQTNTVSFDLNDSITPTSASWAVGDTIYYSRGFNPLNYYVLSISGTKIYLDSTTGLDTGSYITAGLNSASTVNLNVIYKIKNVNVEFNYIELDRNVIPSTISSIVGSTTSSIRELVPGSTVSSGSGYIIENINSNTIRLSTLENLSVGTILTSDNSTNNYGNLEIATITAINNDRTVVLNTVPTSYILNAQLYINNTTYTGYRVSAINSNVITLNRVDGLEVGDTLSLSTDPTATPHLEILSIGTYPNNTVTVNATTQDIDNSFIIPNVIVYRGYNGVSTNLNVIGANYLTNKLNLNYVRGLNVNDNIIGRPLNRITISSVGNESLTPFNGTYTEKFYFDNTFIYNLTSWDPEGTEFGIVAGSTIYKKDNDEIYIWNRKDTSTSQGGWHITYPNTSYPWLYLSTGNPQSSSLTSTGTWKYVQAGVTASQLNVNNSANVIFSLFTGTVDGNPTTITAIDTANNIITVTEADQIPVGSTIRIGTSVQSKCKVRHKDLIGKFRMDNGDFNSSSSYLLADGTQMKVYRFKLDEEL